MSQPEPIIPRAQSPFGYFWTIQGDWNLAVKIGLITLAVVAAFAWLSGPGLNQNLNESFRVATESLHGLPLEKPAQKKTSHLTKTRNEDSWCGIVRLREASGLKPYLWTATVERNGEVFTCTEHGLREYNREMATGLGLEVFSD
jgi:hypothetical protein